MNFVEIMVGEKLKEADPALDIMGSDRKVLQVACQDFTNYLKFHWNLIGKEASQCELVERLENLFREDPSELDGFLTVWIGIWFKKWKERVKLLIGDQNASRWNKISKNISNAEPVWKRIENKQELLEIVVATLVKNGEICGTEILSENLLKMELGEKRVQEPSDKERIFTAVNDALRKAREMAQSKGPLIFVKIDKGYYNTTSE
ncbi:MAG: YbaB/EbfC family nucleoid-associated protein [Candidatus Bathyarchaeia archaeon]